MQTNFIEHKYKFEMNDLRCILQLINVALIVFVGFNVGATFGLVIAICGIINLNNIESLLNKN